MKCERNAPRRLQWIVRRGYKWIYKYMYTDTDGDADACGEIAWNLTAIYIIALGSWVMEVPTAIYAYHERMATHYEITCLSKSSSRVQIDLELQKITDS